MAAFMNGLLKMNMRGIVIILIVMMFRFLLKRLGIGHKYIAGLWIMAFLFFVIPWKIRLPIGFWGNVPVTDEMWLSADMARDMNGGAFGIEDGNIHGNGDPAGVYGTGGQIGGGDDIYGDNAGNRDVGSFANDAGMIGNLGDMGIPRTVDDLGDAGGMRTDSLLPGKVLNTLAVLWLAGLIFCFGHMLYSCVALKRKLALSILYRDNIWWAENIDMPMVFGLIRPRVYLPFDLEDENLAYVISHEEMHIRRKDGLLKMAAYIVCLIHWFNPLIWAAFHFLGSDLEKACDEAVIGSLEEDSRKEYAYALIRIASRDREKKRKAYATPMGFAEGNLKSRVKNVMKYKYTLPGLGAAAIMAILVLSVLFMTEAEKPAETPGAGNAAGEKERQLNLSGKGDWNDPAGEEKQSGITGTDGQNSALPAFYVQDLDSLSIREPFSVSDYYITNRRSATNHYYIDEGGVLWGTGQNTYGQLGTGTYGRQEEHQEPVKIAENVVSVDASANGYFSIFLTDNGELYGVGLNLNGMLLGKGSETMGYMDSYQKVTEPVLLMTNVVYAKVDGECIVALQADGSAYWWGQYTSTALSHVPYFEDFIRLDEDDTNPAKMYACEPRKMMDDCIYITTGNFTGAAINEAGELYLWGLNVYGQCGIPVSEEDDYIREPVKVMDGVKMVWVDSIAFGDPEKEPTVYAKWNSDYIFTVFLLKEDGTLMAAGLNLGDKEKVTELTGGMEETCTRRYGDSFIPIRAVDYFQ